MLHIVGLEACVREKWKIVCNANPAELVGMDLKVCQTTAFFVISFSKSRMNLWQAYHPGGFVAT
jgi:hypothetical protein